MKTQALFDPLPPAPDKVVDPDGEPRFGTYQGLIPHVAWDGLQGAFARPAWWRRLHQKRWQYVGIAHPDCFLGVAIADVGWAANAFAYCFDRTQQAVVGGLSEMGLPGLTAAVGGSPGEGALSWFSAWHSRIRCERPPGSAIYHLHVTHPDLTIEAEIRTDGAPPWLAAVLPIAGGVANATHKSGPLHVRGSARSGGRTFDLASATASLDHTIGLLARDTAWRWASAHRPGLGFNLQAGFNGDGENVLWLDGSPIRLAAARFDFDPAAPLAPWRLHTADGLLDLTFRPEGARREDTNLGIAQSRYIQPIGTFSGTVRRSPDDPGRPVEDLLGVTEDHFARW
jgi:hypothetical protein